MDLSSPPSHRPTLYGMRHMVVAGHHLAAAAAMRILEAGGTAIDAGVAAGFALNVTQPDMANLGGVAPITLFHAATGKVTTFAGVGCWPRAASLEELRRIGGGRMPPGIPRWVVPAAVDAWLHALERYGTMTVGEVLAPAIELAARGFPVNYFLRHNLTVHFERMSQWRHTKEVFYPEGRVPELGEPFVQTALAGTLKQLVAAEATAGGSREAGVRAARDAFYRGDIAEEIGRFARDSGAYLTASDLNAYEAKEEPPLSVGYRGCRVFSTGPWSQGPAVLGALGVLDGLDLHSLSPLDATHVTIEAVKLALTDRNRWFGDPEFVNVPMDRLLSAAHLRAQRERIALDSVTDLGLGPRPGNASPDTTYVCVVDERGNAFSATPSDSTVFVTPMVPGLGMGISNRGLQSSLDPANPNVMAPGKRPRLTPNPGLLVGPNGSVMPYGSPGSDVQTQAMVQVLVQFIDRGLELQAAVEQPRWATYGVPLTEDPHPVTPDLIRLERDLFDDMADGLAAKGHVVEPWPPLAALAGGVCAVHRDGATGVLRGAADPRRMSYGYGW